MALLVVVGVLLALVAFAAVFFSPKQRQKRGLDRLRRQYLQMIQVPPAVGQQTLQRVLREMKAQYPDRSTRWHLQRMISDLQRDRR